jgi:hypothetical protein
MHVLGEFRADAFSSRNLIDTHSPQSIDRAKFPKKQVLPVLAHARAVIKNAFVDAFL